MLETTEPFYQVARLQQLKISKQQQLLFDMTADPMLMCGGGFI